MTLEHDIRLALSVDPAVHHFRQDDKSVAHSKQRIVDRGRQLRPALHHGQIGHDGHDGNPPQSGGERHPVGIRKVKAVTHRIGLAVLLLSEHAEEGAAEDHQLTKARQIQGRDIVVMYITLLLVGLADQPARGNGAVDGKSRITPHLGAVLRESLDQQTVILLVGQHLSDSALTENLAEFPIGAVGESVYYTHDNSVYPPGVISRSSFRFKSAGPNGTPSSFPRLSIRTPSLS